MTYEAPLYRPPSEARSLILQLTLGCSHNQCTFCYMYKGKPYRVKSPEAMREHIAWGKAIDPGARRIFLADGNVLGLETPLLLEILTTLYREFPALERVSLYGGPGDMLGKTPEELASLHKTGLQLVYLGVESGSDTVLQQVRKGVTSEEMITAGVRVREAGIHLSCMLISGLGGTTHWEEHALESARVISAINPEYLGLLTLLVEDNTPLHRQIQQGSFHLLPAEKVLAETRLLLENLQVTDCTFRSNHPSNYLNLAGVLNQDQQRLLAEIQEAGEQGRLRPEGWRAL
ncbi:radical SAM protein [Anoxynatronum buryatiense]|uniref:Radical SAM superfamily protein n=1 Tax=Anoxynatronum buryatiense TaxID=489973 RepID=A0AA45WWQ3_9CLOT|nr:radical SAM protein [Anoxynatronum buryatiense]SMP59009.1 Radical SAM superfamily protein [Anoxynatronum buryatiense]